MADYVEWRKNDGTQAGYDLWAANFGATAGSGSGGADAAGSVPEPAGLVLVLVGSLVAGLRRQSIRGG
jgi:hypothetical protein